MPRKTASKKATKTQGKTSAAAAKPRRRSRTRKKMPPLPEGSAQARLPEADATAVAEAASPTDVDMIVARQRAEARERAFAARKQMKGLSRVDILSALATGSAQINAATREISAAGHQMQTAISEVETSAQEAASATTQSLNAAREILGAAHTSLKASNLSLQRIENIETLINLGVRGVQGLIRGISTAQEVNTAAGAAVRQVDRQSLKISKQLEAIGAVAESISLLSFNAALEASRAGRHGAGFSIVADEVRQLAAKASQSTRQVEEIISEIGVRVAKSVTDMEESLVDGQRWQTAGEGLLAQLQRCNANVNQVQQDASSISSRAQELSDGLTRAERETSVVKGATRNAERAANEANNALAEQQNALRGIESAAKEIAERTLELQQGGDQGVAVEELSTIADELSATVQETSASATQITDSLDLISEEAARLQQSTAANEDLFDRIENAMEVSQQLAASSASTTGELSDLLGSTREAVAELTDSVDSAAVNNLRYAENVRTLDGEILRIEESIDAMLSMSIITNVLAVNGRIEGARAGEHGGGFTTVSEDIRSLAEETASQVLSMRRMLRSMQLAVGLVAADLEKAGYAVRAEVENGRGVSDRLAGISDDITGVLTGTQEIATALQQASASAMESRSALQQIASAASQTATATQEAASASQQQASSISQLASSVDEMAVQIPYLK
jgi:methyl-accepting chemotaxis protein